MRDFTPRPYQTLALDFIASNPRCALWAGMGMGKTSTSLNYLDILHNVIGEDRPSLVVAPKRVAKDTWPNETQKWNHLKGLELVPIVGTPEERKALLRQDRPIFTINYEQLPWLVEELGNRWPFRTLVADEATKLKGYRMNQGGQRAAALGVVAHKRVERFVELTGTPSPNGLQDLWGQMWFLDKGAALGQSYTAFMDRWFGFRNTKDPKTDRVFTERYMFPHAQDEIMGLLKGLCLTLDPKDWFDLQEPIVNVVEVELPPSARRHYREMEREMFTVLAAGQEVEAVSAASKSMKCLQAASGAMYLDAERYGKGVAVEIHDAKLEALESLAEESDVPVLVAYHFKSDRDRIMREWKDQAADLATDEGLAAFRTGRIKIGLGHPDSIGHGVDGLQDVTNVCCFFSQWWDLEKHDQFVERVGPVRQAQSGHERPTFIHYLVARNTVDQLVLDRRNTKRSVQDLLLDYMKAKR